MRKIWLKYKEEISQANNSFGTLTLCYKVEKYRSGNSIVRLCLTFLTIIHPFMYFS